MDRHRHSFARRICFAEGSNSGSLADLGIGRVICIDRRGARAEILAEGFAVVTDVALDPTHAYFTDPRRGFVARVPLTGGGVEILASDVGAQRLAVHGARVYFAAGENLYVVPVTGGPPTPLAERTGRIHSIASDGDAVYFTTVNVDLGTGALFRAREGDAAELLQGEQIHPKGVAVDATSIYWAGGNGPPEYVRSLCK